MKLRSMILGSSCVLIGLLLASSSAFPQVLKGSRPAINVKLGLWEQTTVTQMAGTPPMDADTGKLTPEQRARMDAMMKAVKQRAAMPHTTRTCLTREKLDKSFFENDDSSCKYTVITNSATVYAFKTECGGQRASTGEWHFEALSPENVKGIGKMTFGANEMTSTSTMTAKWIAASCGDVK